MKNLIVKEEIQMEKEGRPLDSYEKQIIEKRGNPLWEKSAEELSEYFKEYDGELIAIIAPYLNHEKLIFEIKNRKGISYIKINPEHEYNVYIELNINRRTFTASVEVSLRHATHPWVFPVTISWSNRCSIALNDFNILFQKLEKHNIITENYDVKG